MDTSVVLNWLTYPLYYALFLIDLCSKKYLESEASMYIPVLTFESQSESSEDL